MQTSLTSYFSSQFISLYVVLEAFKLSILHVQYNINKISMESEYTFTHIKLWKESGIIDKRRIKGYSSSQVARKSSSPVPALGIIEIRLESARAHATSFYSVN